ncbi:dCTP deaminase [Candidatus Woesearchaeota archaeon]|nr:dCTP deaminase [Candidatus Woesearchaeota archaeon]RLE40663.1 MAG: dCTP deaminase [Candidatus Woesearchaeota archaeon]
MILTKDIILSEIKKGRIKIVPFNQKNIGPASIDLTLDNKFRIFKKERKTTLSEKTDCKAFSKKVVSKELVLHPGDFALGITREKISLPENICGFLTGRSRFARLGLVVHSTAAFVHPGINNKQVLEMQNLGKLILRIPAGTRICQLILARTEGKAKYIGKFKKQESI